MHASLLPVIIRFLLTSILRGWITEDQAVGYLESLAGTPQAEEPPKKSKGKRKRAKRPRAPEPPAPTPEPRDGALWTPAAVLDEANALPTECGSGRIKGCGETFYRLSSEGKTCPECKAGKAAKRAEGDKPKGKRKKGKKGKGKGKAPKATAAELLHEAGAEAESATRSAILPQGAKWSPEPGTDEGRSPRACTECKGYYWPNTYNRKRCFKGKCDRRAHARGERTRPGKAALGLILTATSLLAGLA